MGTWRDYLAPIIADVISRVGRTNPQQTRRALRAAWPCGERRHWPYKVWLDEINRQLGRRFPRDKLTRDLFEDDLP